MAGWSVQMAQQGVDMQRVDLIGLHPDTGSHLESYAAVDIALDPWPYAGTTTTAEAMLMACHWSHLQACASAPSCLLTGLLDSLLLTCLGSSSLLERLHAAPCWVLLACS